MSDEGEDEFNVVNNGELERFAKSQTPDLWKGSEKMWANDEAVELMEEQVEEVVKHVWIKAAKDTEMEGNRTVQPQAVEDAFNEYMHPQELMEDVANKLQKMRWDFLDLASESPAIESPSRPEDDE